MGIKTDREFLRNISVGAVGARKIQEVLRGGSFRLIDTDRTALSPKIWQTKVKRLRVPDLLCLSSGVRIESRAKGKLGIIMSHSENTPGRQWDDGLRDTDIVACIRCYPEGDVGWRAATHVGLFSVGDLRATRKYAKLSTAPRK